MKIHGELPMVALVLGTLVIGGVSVCGFLLGVLFNRRDHAGLEFGAQPEARVPRHGNA